MIDVHAPHESVHTWTDFFIHIGTIAVGLLLAIGLEQTVEVIHHAHERRALIESFHHECAANLKVFDLDLDIVRGNVAWARSSLALLRNATPQNGYITVTLPPETRGGLRAPSRSVWSVARSSGKVELLPENLAEIFDRVDNDGAHFNDMVQASLAAGQRIDSFKDRVGSPLDTAETIHLTLAQRDDAASVIDTFLVQYEQYRFWLASWQGTSQSVLDGVQTRDAMDAYIHRAVVAAAQQ